MSIFPADILWAIKDKKTTIGIRYLWWSWSLSHKIIFFIIDLSICVNIVLNGGIFPEQDIVFPGTLWSWPKLPAVFGCTAIFDLFCCILYWAKKCCLRIIRVSHVKKREVKENNLGPVILPVFQTCDSWHSCNCPLYSAYFAKADPSQALNPREEI